MKRPATLPRDPMPSDAEAAHLRERDPAAFERACAGYAAAIATREAKEWPGEVQDYQGEAMLASLHAARTWEPSRGRLKPRIACEAKKAIRRALDRERRHGAPVDPDDVEQPVPAEESAVLAEKLLSHLDEVQRIVVQMRALEFSWREIGRELDVSHEGARQMFAEACGALPEQLAQEAAD